MKLWIVAATVSVLSIAQPADAQDSRSTNFEAGVVMGVIAVPYVSVGIDRNAWLLRVSGTATTDDCHAVQVNAGRVLRDEHNAKHSVAAMWAKFRNECWNYGSTRDETRGRYVGVVYNFQVKGFFLEAGPAFGSENPFAFGLGGPLSHIYGQVGYVHRFGKKYEQDPEEKD
jgi:hypothetical protein